MNDDYQSGSGKSRGPAEDTFLGPCFAMDRNIHRTINHMQLLLFFPISFILYLSIDFIHDGLQLFYCYLNRLNTRLKVRLTNYCKFALDRSRESIRLKAKAQIIHFFPIIVNSGIKQLNLFKAEMD